LTGAPASGKGTQCEFLVEKFKIQHISTGDLLREEVKSGSEIGLQARDLMKAGKLVPDSIMNALVIKRLSVCTNGWLLDGFPRTPPQAQALVAAGFIPDFVISLHVPDRLLIERVINRRIDPQTHKVYHLKFNPPPDEIVNRLIQRQDDTEETMVVRLQQYRANSHAVRSQFKGRVVDVNGDRHKTEVFASILSGLAPLSRL
jgi:adenylate kinase